MLSTNSKILRALKPTWIRSYHLFRLQIVFPSAYLCPRGKLGISFCIHGTSKIVFWSRSRYNILAQCMTAKKGQIQVEHEFNYSLKDYIGIVHLVPSQFLKLMQLVFRMFSLQHRFWAAVSVRLISAKQFRNHIHWSGKCHFWLTVAWTNLAAQVHQSNMNKLTYAISWPS
jgi:hypothetical protein